MVSGTMALTVATLTSGSSAVKAQRGTQTWGANYTFSPSGLQNDIAVIADALAATGTSGTFTAPIFTGDVTFSASGSSAVGSAAAPIAVSGIYMNGPAGVPYRLVILPGGLVSGVAA
jgi:hypothetical protein